MGVAMNTKVQNPPSRGEWAAVVGYEPQYSVAAQVALKAAQEGVLRAIRLIDPNADIADEALWALLKQGGQFVQLR